MADTKIVYLAGKPGCSMVYIGIPTDLGRAIGHINAMRDPGDLILPLWSTKTRFGKTILQAYSDRRRRPGRWHDLGNVSAVIEALDEMNMRDRDLRLHENALEEARKFHTAAVDAAQDALDNAINDLADAPESQPAAPADLDLPRESIISLLQARGRR
jgi:hypothetical protein